MTIFRFDWLFAGVAASLTSPHFTPARAAEPALDKRIILLRQLADETLNVG
jgi:hypothetical protein